ncbi:SpoIID/LytB domain-containing protein [Promicromonospora iranensis]|uniref:SpoIID/LytB domain-containing protein n=1 Tax=Promicromonospora iranensis TaxID=1105144 RepID=UPI0031584AF8
MTALLLLAHAVPASAAVPGSFAIKGSGYGHGIGMPQYGAYQMAREGASATRILRHYYTDASASHRSTPVRIGVQVHGPDPYGFRGYGDTRDSTRITVAHGWWRLVAGGKQIESGPAGRLSVTASDGSVVVRADGRKLRRDRMVLEWAGTPQYKPTARPATVSVGGAHGTYRHGRMVISASRGVPNIVNELRLTSEYLYGIAEMPSSWGATGGREALRAQAVVARSYAVLKARDWKPRCRCHVVDDVRDQQFSGWEKEAEATYGKYWRSAVDATWTSARRGRVLTSEGRPVEAHYFSSSGGRTANSEDVWSTALPYERSVSDPYSKKAPGNSYASWTRVLHQSKARELFGLGNVASIKVTSRYSSGQARTLTATSARGATSTIRGKADQVRTTVGPYTVAGSLPSAWIGAVRSR